MKKNNLLFLATCFMTLGGTLILSACNSQNIVIGGEGNTFNMGAEDYVPLSKGVSIPSQYPEGTWVPESSVRQISAVTWKEENSGNSDMPESLAKQCLDQELMLETRPGPYNHPISAADFSGNIFYVNAKTTNGDGTQAKPFNKIANAINAAISSRKTAAILVASGTYAEDINLRSGLNLLGGFNSSTWKRDLQSFPSIIQNTKGSLNISGDESDELTTLLDGFTIYGSTSGAPSISIANNAAAILRNNTIYMSMGEVTWQTYGDTHYGTAINSYQAKAQIYQNRFLIDSPTPEHTISEGVYADSSCITFANNHSQSYRNPFRSVRGAGSIWNNLLEDSYNGISSYDEQLHIEGNTLGLLEHENGCGYAIYLGAFGGNPEQGPKTNPKIIGNHFVLEGNHSKGIDETYAAADPAALVDNIFIVVDPESKPMLYGDYDQPHDQGKIHKSLFTMEEIEALQDIPLLEGNILIQ